MVKKGTATQNEHGLRLAATMHQHELRPNFVRKQMESHLIDVLETRCRKAVRREIPKVLHEYACFENSLLGTSAQRWLGRAPLGPSGHGSLDETWCKSSLPRHR